jgi:superfamily I DNA/RNA helicase
MASDPWTITIGEDPNGGAVSAPPASCRKRLVGTEQQEAFWSHLIDADSHVVLIARAGTGKSTSCREAIWRLQESHPGIRCSYVAFNRAIAQEFQSRLPFDATATTMHGAGFSAIKACISNVSKEPAKFKMYDIARGFIPRNDRESRQARTAVVNLARLCKGYLLDGTDRAKLERLAASHGINLGTRRALTLDLVPVMLEECLNRCSTVDFSDMTWLPVMLGLDFPPCDVLFVDEAQDLDPCQHALVQRIAGAGRLCVVGDPRQAIYGFRGADTRSIETLEGQLAGTPRGCKSLPLTMTRRCPSSHVELAQAIVPDFEALPDAPEGFLDEDVNKEDVLAPGVMALCRMNAPLVSVAYQLIRSNVPIAIQGRDIGEGLIKLAESFDATTTAELSSAVYRYRAAETERLAELDGAEDEIEALNDQCGAVLAVAAGCHSVSEVTAKIGSLFKDVAASDQASYVLLSSIHRAKGRESDDVAIICPELIPHKMATSPSAQEQERNLAYVAATRSRKFLSFCGPVPTVFN